MDLFLLYLYAYLIGSIPTAYVIGRLVKGIDIRQFGSGNVGGSNVYVHVGKWWTAALSIFEIFVKEGVYKQYAEKYLGDDQLDEVDEAAVLA